MKATSIRLTDKRETALLETAERLKCFSASGQPSWRVMLQMIADGFLSISNPNDKSRRVYVNFTRPPGWWKPDESNSMLAADVAAKYKTTVEILEEKGFVVDGDRIFPGNWKAWLPGRKTEDKAPKLKDGRFPVSTVSPPAWFVPESKNHPVMRVEDAEVASGYSRGAMENSGMRLIKTADGVLVAWPHDDAWSECVPSAPTWFRPDSDGGMDIDEAEEASGMSVAALLAAGFESDDVQVFFRPKK